MIRIVSEFQNGKNHLLVLCDHPQCGCYASNPIDMADQNKSVAAILSACVSMLGWAIGILGATCPEHAKQAMELLKQQQKMVTVHSSVNGSILVKH